MKPCSTNRKHLAWLALGALDECRARDLRMHIKTCEGCRRYLDEISSVTQRLIAKEMPHRIQTSEAFHQRVVGALKVDKPESGWKIMAAYLRENLLSWRVALPASGVAALAIAGVSLIWRPGTPLVPPFNAPSASVAKLKTDLPPTIANYTMAANQSLEILDDLLSRQACKNPPPARTYTVSNLTD